MIKLLYPRGGKLIFYFLERKEKLATLNNKDFPGGNKILSADGIAVFFEDESKRFDLTFCFLQKEYVIHLCFKLIIDEEDSNTCDEHFTFPRLKKLQNEKAFIVSGLFQIENNKWLVLGKFQGLIPNGYKYHEDELIYEGFKNL